MTFSKSYQPTYTYQPHDLGLVAISKISVTTHSDINFFDSHQYEDFTQNQKKKLPNPGSLTAQYHPMVN